MYHGGHDKGEGVAASAQGGPFGNGLQAVVDVQVEELAYHVRRLGIGDDGHFGITQQQVLNQGTMVGFHVVHHKVVEFAAIQHGGHILEKLSAHRGVGGVEQHGLFVHQDIAVV